MKTVKPAFYDSFNCISSNCKDNCCRFWVIDISKEDMKYFKTFGGSFGEKMRAATGNYKSRCFIQKNGACPFLCENGLCEMYIENGPDSLRGPCATYPRFCHDFGEYRECGMYMSCPVIASFIFDAGKPLEYVALQNPNEPPACNCIDPQDYIRLSTAYLKLLEICAADIGLETKLSVILKCTALLDKGHAPDYTYQSLISLQDFSSKPFGRLEYLQTDISARLSPFANTCDDSAALTNLLLYFMHGYFMPAVYDGKAFEKAAFIVGSVIAVLHMDIFPLSEAARIYSKEIEHSDKNIDRLMRFWRRYYGRKIKL